MEHWWYIWFPIILAFLLIYLPQKKRRRIIAGQKIAKNKGVKKRTLKEMEIMRELVQRFIGKDCYINLLEGSADGVLKEVTEDGMVLENHGKLQVVNLNYVVKIREYPYKKGKRITFIGT
ncbi:MAG: hypothetical protein PHX08_10400 [Lachnospiraceae bacterium]|nr:hypothetical protein [Lachnospiraceae bacterium]